MLSRPPFPPTRPAARDVSRRAFLAAIAGGTAALALTGCAVVSGGAVSAGQQGFRLSKDPAPGRQNTIEMYNIWGGTLGNAWVLLAEVAPELSEWASFFAAGAAKRAAAEAGSTRAVSEREADDLVRDADRFLAVIEQALGLVPHASVA